MSVANYMGDNEIILELCTDLLAFALELRKPDLSYTGIYLQRNRDIQYNIKNVILYEYELNALKVNYFQLIPTKVSEFFVANK